MEPKTYIFFVKYKTDFIKMTRNCHFIKIYKCLINEIIKKIKSPQWATFIFFVISFILKKKRNKIPLQGGIISFLY